MADSQNKSVRQSTAYLLGQINAKLEAQNGAVFGLAEQQKKLVDAVHSLPCDVMEERVSGLEQEKAAKVSRTWSIIIGFVIGGGVAILGFLLERGFN